MPQNSANISGINQLIKTQCENNLPKNWRFSLTDIAADNNCLVPVGSWGLVLLRPYTIFYGPSTPGYGRLASIGYERDYHLDLYDQLEKITLALESLLGHLPRDFYVDKDGGDDRQVAYGAGLGFYGKNNLLINTDLGSGFNIGYAVFPPIDGLEFSENQGVQLNGCGDCQKCIQACPTQALLEGMPLNRSKCRSAINQKSGELDLLEQEAMGEWVYGCDVCQWVCPYNQSALVKGAVEIELAPLVEMSQKAIKLTYGNRSFGYLGGGRLKRNGRIVQRYWEKRSFEK